MVKRNNVEGGIPEVIGVTFPAVAWDGRCLTEGCQPSDDKSNPELCELQARELTSKQRGSICSQSLP
jgi:hypothetical protein